MWKQAHTELIQNTPTQVPTSGKEKEKQCSCYLSQTRRWSNGWYRWLYCDPGEKGRRCPISLSLCSRYIFLVDQHPQCVSWPSLEWETGAGYPAPNFNGTVISTPSQCSPWNACGGGHSEPALMGWGPQATIWESPPVIISIKHLNGLGKLMHLPNGLCYKERTSDRKNPAQCTPAVLLPHKQQKHPHHLLCRNSPWQARRQCPKLIKWAPGQLRRHEVQKQEGNLAKWKRKTRVHPPAAGFL